MFPPIVILLGLLPLSTGIVTPRVISFSSHWSLRTPPIWPLSARSLVLTSTCCGYGPYTAGAVANASETYGLFDVPCMEDASFGVPVLAEWGYEFLNNQNGIFPVCGNLTEAAYPSPPAARGDALSRMGRYFECRAADARGSAPNSTPLVSEIGHYLFSGQSVSFPNDYQVIPGSEVGENINSINLHLAASRGAAMPQNSSFLIDFSSWFNGFLADFSAQRFWGDASSPLGGHSASLHRRTLFAAYFAGVGAYVAEAGAVNYFLAVPPAGGPLALSPLGEVGEEFYGFTHGTDDARGASYVPIAFASSPASGLGLGFFYRDASWDSFPLTDNERRLLLLLSVQWPGSLTVESQIGTPASETGYLVQGRESVDFILLSNHTPLSLSNAYRAVFFTGAGRVDDAPAAALLQGYVEAGGCAIVSADDIYQALQAGWFPSNFFGLSFSNSTPPGPPPLVTSVSDLETGWSRTCSSSGSASSEAKSVPPAPFCVPQSGASPSWYIKTGGNASKVIGWDPSLGDKCCSSSPSSCLWFPDESLCTVAISLASCRSCNCGGSDDVGCPAWSGSSSIPLEPYYPASLIGSGRALLEFTRADDPSHTGLLGAVESFWGSNGGKVVSLLAPSSSVNSAFDISLHLLSRLNNDTLPFYISSNMTTDTPGVGGVQTLFNKLRSEAWVLTLINNNGVVKQPNASASIDPAEGRLISVGLLSGAGDFVVQSVSSRDGGNGVAVPLDWNRTSQSCTVEVPAGGLRILEISIA